MKKADATGLAAARSAPTNDTLMLGGLGEGNDLGRLTLEEIEGAMGLGALGVARICGFLTGRGEGAIPLGPEDLEIFEPNPDLLVCAPITVVRAADCFTNESAKWSNQSLISTSNITR